jgi:hypothetical protein
MRIDFKDDWLAVLAKLHEHRSEFEDALADGRLQLRNGGELLRDEWPSISLRVVLQEVVGSQMNGFRNMSLIIKPKSDYMHNTRTGERVEVPDRFQEEPKAGEKYYLETLSANIGNAYNWGNLTMEKTLFKHGLIHKTRKSAEIARKARLGL